MGNNTSQNKDISRSNSYAQVSDQLNDLIVELIKIESIYEHYKFLNIMDNLIKLLESIIKSPSNYAKKPLDVSYLNVIKNWTDHNTLLKACYIKSKNESYYFKNTDRTDILRSLITINKYCEYQKIPVYKFFINETSLPFINETSLPFINSQVKKYFINNAKNIPFPSQKDSIQKDNSFTKSFQNTLISNSDPNSNSPKSDFGTSTSNSYNQNKSNYTISAKYYPLPANSSISRRLAREKKQLETYLTEGIRLKYDLGRVWIVEIDGAKGTLYENETFTIRFTFEGNYPIDSPEVVFTNTPPLHPHIYSNGYICLSILYDGWSPALGVIPICLSIISMLSSCKKKQKPDDDYAVSFMKNSKPKETIWAFHDDKI